jgi:aromatic ring hydroxylase
MDGTRVVGAGAAAGNARKLQRTELRLGQLNDANLARDFQNYWQTPQCDAVTRMKLFKLTWDLIGSEFAGRHQQYEKFYAGASFILRNHSFRETDWPSFMGIVERLMDSYDYPAGKPQERTVAA